MRRFLNWIFWLPLAIVVIAFCVANRRWIPISFDPFSSEAPFASLEMPVWALLFAGLFIGIVTGWIACWFAQGRWRRAMRESRVETQKVHDEIAKLRRDAEARNLIPVPPNSP